MANAGSTLNQHRVVRYDPITPEGWNALRASILVLYDSAAALAERAPDSLFVVVRDAVTGDHVPAPWILSVSAAPADRPEALLPPAVRVGDRYLIVDPAPGDYIVSIEPAMTTGYQEATAMVTMVEGSPAVVDIELERVVNRRQVPAVFAERFFVARDRVHAAGLQVGQVMDTHGHALEPADWPRCEDHLVVSSEPGGGATVQTGAEVDLLLAALPFPHFPDLRGLSLAAAQALITGFVATYHLIIGAVEVVEQEAEAGNGAVVEQVPFAGAEVFVERLDVKLVVLMPARAVTPDLVGRRRDEVEALLAAAQLTLGSIGVQESATAADHDRVASQAPAAGERVPFGSAVQIIIWQFTQVTAPDLGGMTQAQAQAALEGVGLVLHQTVAQQVATDPALDGRVASQDPPAGAVLPKGSLVRITLWRVPRVVTPNLMGMTLTTATAAIQAAGLALAAPVTEQPTNTPALDRTVAAQQPAPGVEVFQGSIVLLTIWRVAMVTVPNIIGMTVDAARAAVTSRGLALVDGGRRDTLDPALVGLVAAQNPLDGAQVLPGSRVTVELWQLAQVAVPNVVGMTVDAARLTVTGRGLTLVDGGGRRDTLDSALVGLVAAQNPSAGAQVPAGSRVTVDLWQLAQVVVPNVLGRTEAEARRALQEQSLQVSVRTEPVSSPDQVGRVIAQSPAAGSRVTPGSVVTLTIGSQATAAFPEVRCRHQEQAHVEIKEFAASTGLLWDGAVDINPVASDQEPNTVVDQQPAAGETVGPALSGVSLTVRQPAFPDLRCLHLAEHEVEGQIKMWADRNGFQIADLRITTAPSDRTPETVLRQAPAALSANYDPRGVAVELQIAESRQQPLRGLPELLCLEEPAARELTLTYAARNNLQLRIGVRGLASLRPEGIVLNQSPAPGAIVQTGATITLSVSRPPMPDVICLNIDEASSVIKEAAANRDLSIDFTTVASTLPRNTVVAQSPAAGAAMPAASQAFRVNLSISNGGGRTVHGPRLDADLEQVAGIGPARAARLRAVGVVDAASLARASAADVAAALGVGESFARQLIANAQGAS